MPLTRALVFAAWSISLITACGSAIADAPLLNMDSRARIPGQYYVQFKPHDELVAIPSEGVGAPKILPKVRPLTKAAVEKLAKALAMSAKAEVLEVIPGRGRSGFTIQAGTDESLREIAKDPRIAFVEPVMKTKFD
jgi:hypothetical protein